MTMNKDNGSSDNTLRIFASATQPCSYLDEEESSSLFIDPEANINSHTYSYLSQLGFRRSGKFIYRPDCMNCQACIPIRIDVNAFTMSKSQQRIYNKNKDLAIVACDNIDTEQHYRLYANYIQQRHHDGDMYPPSIEQYTGFLNNPFGNTRFFNIELQQRLIAVAVVDVLDDGFSAVYTFYDPDEDKRSLGTFAVLWQLHYAKQCNMDYLYLGYWIKSSQKMAYKSRFKPAEILMNKQWRPLMG